jgi:hypothetical protein
MQSLGCVLAATVRGARGSRVPLIIGLSCTRRSRRHRATKPHFHAPGWAARPMTTDKDEVPGSSPGRPTIVLPAQRADAPNPVALPARLGRGGAARPPQPSSQGPCRSGRPQGPGPPPEPHSWSPPLSSPGHGRPPAANPALTTCAQPCHSLGCTARLPAPPDRRAILRNRRVPGRPCDRTRSAARAPPRRRPGPARRDRWPSTACAGSAVWLPDALHEGTRADTTDADGDAERGHRRRTPRTMDTRTLGTGRADIARADTARADTARADTGHRTRGR